MVKMCLESYVQTTTDNSWWMLFLFLITKQLQIITEMYNSLQLSLVIGYYNLYYIKTDNWFYNDKKLKKNKIERQSPQDDFNNKHWKVVCLLVIPTPSACFSHAPYLAV